MTEQAKKRMNAIGRFMEVWDWVWSFPLSLFLFWFSGYWFGKMGMSVGTFDISFLQPLFLASTIVIGANVTAIYALRFNWKTVYRFMFSSKVDEVDMASSSKGAFKALLPWQKLLCMGLLFGTYFAAVIIVYLKIL